LFYIFLTHLRILRSYVHYYQKQFASSLSIFYLIAKLESLCSSLSVNFNWNDCIWEFKISIYLKLGYLFFALESTLKKELVIKNVRAICWIVPKKYLLHLDQTILLHFRSSIDRPLNLPQYPGSNKYFSIPEENT
jgi:hypothetical protein